MVPGTDGRAAMANTARVESPVGLSVQSAPALVLTNNPSPVPASNFVPSPLNASAWTLRSSSPWMRGPQVAPASVLRNTPRSVPAYNTEEFVGSNASVSTMVWVRPTLLDSQLPAASVVLKTPPPLMPVGVAGKFPELLAPVT